MKEAFIGIAYGALALGAILMLGVIHEFTILLREWCQYQRARVRVLREDLLYEPETEEQEK
jgi:hypothetical protein